MARSRSLAGGGVDGAYQAVDLVDAQGVGEFAASLRGLDQLGGRRGDQVVEEHEVEEALDAAQIAGLRALFAPLLEQHDHVVFNHVALDPARRHVVITQNEVGEILQIAHVGFDGIARKMLLEEHVGTVSPRDFRPFIPVFRHIISNFVGCEYKNILHNNRALLMRIYRIASNFRFGRPTLRLSPLFKSASPRKPLLGRRLRSLRSEIKLQ